MSKQEWIEVGAPEDIPLSGARLVCTPEGNVAVFRTHDGEIFALRDACPHKGGPLSQGIVYGHRVACPMHNLSMDLETGTAVAPDTGCATRYPVRIEGGKLYLGKVGETTACACAGG